MTPTALTDNMLIYQKDYLENNIFYTISYTISNKKLHFYMIQLRKCNL